MRRTVFVLGAAILLGACGGGGAGTPASTSAAASAPRPARGSANVITEAEIAAANVNNAYEAIQRLRPTMLRGRGSASSSDQSGTQGLVIYVDGSPLGGVQALGNISALNVREIRYLNASDATTRFGTGHPVGAILVTTRR
jgi:hypothetical protein